MLHAYAWASGLIELSRYPVPRGAIELLSGEDEAVRCRIQACARLAYDNESWLVPGIPEAQTPAAKIDALVRFSDRLRQ